MKRINSILVIFSLVGLFTTSCLKDNELGNKIEKTTLSTTTAAQVMHKNIIKSSSGPSAFEGVFQLASNMGHKSTDCGGRCKYTNGTWTHVDCNGFGSTCSLRASIMVSYDKVGNVYNGKGLNDYEPTDMIDFNMPARSFYLGADFSEEGYCWLNIPEQLLERDHTTNNFIYKDITFTREQIFENR